MHDNLGTKYGQMENIPAAKKEWITALELSPRSEFVLLDLGLVAHAEKNYPQEWAFFLYALSTRPNYMDAHLDLGRTCDAMAFLDAARAEFIEAEKLSPLSA